MQDLNILTKDFVVGTGNPIDKGKIVTVQFGAEEDGSLSTSTFTYGNNEIPIGIEIGLQGMKTGGKRRIIIPPEMNPNIVQRNKSVTIDAELMSVDVCYEKKMLAFIKYRDCSPQ
eukprot:CAMPEP_0196659726 /NCGR_PEP_ID=MMETSP1086-20130531/36411_1 /TAXON_ID=77921 /ORGANISM="Cyanoptyche  gloeocystis , Strain SAG4.97" /LENGTH=114 /DNA_ID=CAMNT_0041993815 /DNA_START=356 /DNA_END=700 /DNA_ORIENTATION=-